MTFATTPQENELLETDILEDIEQTRILILYNDDVNTFDFVISTLVEVCKHTPEQAEQCAYIVHYKGLCDVKNGTYAVLKPMKDQLVDRGLTAAIQ